MTKNQPTTSPFLRDSTIKTGGNSVLNTSPFIDNEATDVEDIVSPFDRAPHGIENNILNTSPFGREVQEEGEIVIRRAYYELQPEQIIGVNGQITLEGPLQIIPIKGSSFEQAISATPFGTSNLEMGSTVTLFGYDDSTPPKMINSRTIDYGVWLNGAVTFYKGYSIQLQLVQMGNYKLWLQISKNF
jgi:hypothetical protein